MSPPYRVIMTSRASSWIATVRAGACSGVIRLRPPTTYFRVMMTLASRWMLVPRIVLMGSLNDVRYSPTPTWMTLAVPWMA